MFTSLNVITFWIFRKTQYIRQSHKMKIIRSKGVATKLEEVSLRVLLREEVVLNLPGILRVYGDAQVRSIWSPPLTVTSSPLNDVCA